MHPSYLLPEFFSRSGVLHQFSCVERPQQNSVVAQTSALIESAHRTKFQPGARVCAFLGYPPGVKGYKFYDVETKQVFLSRDAVFYEEVFPFHAITSSDQIPNLFPDLVLPHSSL
ncbi:hypothetical protein Patl1_24687 [Pistacia atlantica]|uniref:Uncharacterized protein n=1 Tax=Pistacia atlantica TaxID=434234 RepID=A0ACC1B2Z3_9ROSI|nr:hypothetical protein Patl1_24687 [Pistacia atlantica]